jgi:hypothetical protein
MFATSEIFPGKIGSSTQLGSAASEEIHGIAGFTSVGREEIRGPWIRKFAAPKQPFNCSECSQIAETSHFSLER